jgi:hypothetical protein
MVLHGEETFGFVFSETGSHSSGLPSSWTSIGLMRSWRSADAFDDEAEQLAGEHAIEAGGVLDGELSARRRHQTTETTLKRRGRRFPPAPCSVSDLSGPDPNGAAAGVATHDGRPAAASALPFHLPASPASSIEGRFCKIPPLFLLSSIWAV